LKQYKNIEDFVWPKIEKKPGLWLFHSPAGAFSLKNRRINL
jgi:hypothetical protein